MPNIDVIDSRKKRADGIPVNVESNVFELIISYERREEGKGD